MTDGHQGLPSGVQIADEQVNQSPYGTPVGSLPNATWIGMPSISNGFFTTRIGKRVWEAFWKASTIACTWACVGFVPWSSAGKVTWPMAITSTPSSFQRQSSAEALKRGPKPVRGNHEPLRVARQVGLHSPRGRDKPDAGKVPPELEPTDRSGPKRLHDFFRLLSGPAARQGAALMAGVPHSKSPCGFSCRALPWPY